MIIFGSCNTEKEVVRPEHRPLISNARILEESIGNRLKEVTGQVDVITIPSRSVREVWYESCRGRQWIVYNTFVVRRVVSST